MSCYPLYILRFTGTVSEKLLAGGVPAETDTLYLSVEGSGVVQIKVEGARWGLEWVRYFELAAGQDVAVDLTDTKSASVWVVAGTLTGQIVGVASPEQRAPEATSRAYWFKAYAGGAAAVAIHAVPPGAVKMGIASAVSKLRWVLYDNDNTAYYLDGSTALGAVVDLPGPEFEVPAAETLNVFWQIQL